MHAHPTPPDAALYPIEAARAAWLALLQDEQIKVFVAEAILAKHLPDDKLCTGTVDDVPYDRLPAFLADCRAALRCRK